MSTRMQWRKSHRKVQQPQVDHLSKITRIFWTDFWRSYVRLFLPSNIFARGIFALIQLRHDSSHSMFSLVTTLWTATQAEHCAMANGDPEETENHSVFGENSEFPVVVHQ